MAKSTRLYTPVLECVGCGRTAARGAKRTDRKEPVIVGITPYITRRGLGKTAVKNCRSLNACDECLTRALTSGRLGWADNRVRAIWSALQESLLARYTQMVNDDAES